MKNSEIGKMVIKRVIFIVLFFIVSVSIMIYFIIYNLPQEKKQIIVSNKNKEKTISTNKEKTIDINGFYDLNDLKIKKYKENYNGLEIDYFQIDGLKDNGVEVSINYNLKNDVEVMLDKALSENKINLDEFYFYPEINSNFSNTLSITYYLYSYKETSDNNTEEVYDKTICENFNLVTGKKLKLNDIFTKDVPIGNIFSKEMYENTIFEIADMKFNEDEYSYEVKNYNDVEEEIFKVVNDYQSENNINFYFDEQRVFLLDYNSSILYKDYLKYITIYDKYLTEENIFDGSVNNLKKLGVLEKRFNSNYQVLEKGKNYYIDASLVNICEADLKDDKVLKKAKEVLNEEIEKLKQKTEENMENFFVANYLVEIRNDNFYNEETKRYEDYSDRCIIRIVKNEYITTKSLFEKEVFNEIKRTFKDYPDELGGEVYCYNNNFMAYWSYDNYNSYERNIIVDADGIILEDSDTMIPWDVTD